MGLKAENKTGPGEVAKRRSRFRGLRDPPKNEDNKTHDIHTSAWRVSGALFWLAFFGDPGIFGIYRAAITPLQEHA